MQTRNLRIWLYKHRVVYFVKRSSSASNVASCDQFLETSMIPSPTFTSSRYNTSSGNPCYDSFVGATRWHSHLLLLAWRFQARTRRSWVILLSESYLIESRLLHFAHLLRSVLLIRRWFAFAQRDLYQRGPADQRPTRDWSFINCRNQAASCSNRSVASRVAQFRPCCVSSCRFHRFRLLLIPRGSCWSANLDVPHQTWLCTVWDDFILQRRRKKKKSRSRRKRTWQRWRWTEQTMKNAQRVDRSKIHVDAFSLFLRLFVHWIERHAICLSRVSRNRVQPSSGFSDSMQQVQGHPLPRHGFTRFIRANAVVLS